MLLKDSISKCHTVSMVQNWQFFLRWDIKYLSLYYLTAT
jgi:hypothetical protein